MLIYVAVSIMVFVTTSLIVKSKHIAYKSIPYILLIYLILLYFDKFSNLFKIILFIALLLFSLIMALYEDYQKDEN